MRFCFFFFFKIYGDKGHITLRFPVKREIGKKIRLHPPLVGAVNCGELVFFWLLGVAEEEAEDD